MAMTMKTMMMTNFRLLIMELTDNLGNSNLMLENDLNKYYIDQKAESDDTVFHGCY